MTRAPGASRTAGTAAGSALALALLVGGCVFAALAGPALSLHTRSQALQQAMAGFPATTTTVQVNTDWGDFTQALAGGGPGRNLDASALAGSTRELAAGLAAVPLPLGAGAWASLNARPLAVTSGAAASAIAAAPPTMVVAYRDPFTRYARLVAGTYTPRTVPAGAVPVAATAPTAARFGLHPGSRMTLTSRDGPITLLVTAIVTERAPASSFWTEDSTIARPSLQQDTLRSPPFWAGGVIADPGQLAALQDAFGGPGLGMLWEFPLAAGRVTADQAQGLHDALNRAATVTPRLTGTLAGGAGALTVSSPLLQELSLFLGIQAAIETVLLLLFVSLTLTGAAVIVLAARMMVARRDGELAMVRARGGSLRQVAALMLGAAVLAAGPGALIGAGLAATVVPGGVAVPAAGWALAGIAVAAALAGPPLIAAWRHRRPAPASNPARISTAGTRRPRVAWRRLVAEIAAIAASAAGLIVLHDEGVTASGGSNLYLAAVPVLVAVPVVLLMLRLYPLAVRGLLGWLARGSGATGFVALSRAARSSLAGVLPAFALVLALSMATFAGMVSQGISRGEAAASWHATGADVLIQTGPGSPPAGPAAVRAIGAVRGVRAAAAVWATSWFTPSGQPVTVVAVDPVSYAAVVAGTPFPAFAAARLRAAPGGTLPIGALVPVLASPDAAALLGAGTTQLSSQSAMGPVRVRVAGTLSGTPAQPAGGAFVVMPLETLPGREGQPSPAMVLVSGPDIDRARLTAVADRVIPGSTTTFRAGVLASLGGSPLQHGAGLIITLTAGTAAAFGLLIMILGLALGSGERELTLARMAVMGHDRTAGLVLAEAMPAVLAAIAAGAVCAAALPRVIGSSVDLSAFTGTSAPVQLQPDPVALGVPAAAAAVLALAVLAAQARALRRRDLAGLLRAG